MKILKLTLGGTTYTSSRITVYHTREALKIQKEALQIAQKADSLNQQDLEAVSTMLEDLDGLYDRKVCLLCEVYGDQFMADDVERELDEEELEAAVNAIIGRATGVIEKN